MLSPSEFLPASSNYVPMAEPPRERSLSSETIGNSLRTAAATVINAVTSAVSTIVVARALGPTIYGRYTYLGFLIILVLGLSDLGFNFARAQCARAS